MAFDPASRIVTTPTDTAKRILVYGFSGSGKTTFLSTAPDVLTLNFEMKDGSLGGSHRINFTPADDVLEITGEIFAGFLKKSEEYAKYKTIAIDGITAMSEMIALQIWVASNGPLKLIGKTKEDMKGELGHYNTLKQFLITILARFKAVPVNLIVTALPYMGENDVTEVPEIVPMVVGGYRNQVYAAFDDVLYLRDTPGKADGSIPQKFFAHTQPWVNTVIVAADKPGDTSTKQLVFKAKNTMKLPLIIENPTWANTFAPKETPNA